MVLRELPEANLINTRLQPGVLGWQAEAAVLTALMRDGFKQKSLKRLNCCVLVAPA